MVERLSGADGGPGAMARRRIGEEPPPPAAGGGPDRDG